MAAHGLSPSGAAGGASRKDRLVRARIVSPSVRITARSMALQLTRCPASCNGGMADRQRKRLLFQLAAETLVEYFASIRMSSGARSGES